MLSHRERLKELKATIQLAFCLLEGKSVKQIAEISGLSTTTIYNLRRNNISLFCRYNTIQSITLAAGLRISFKKKHIHLRLVG